MGLEDQSEAHSAEETVEESQRDLSDVIKEKESDAIRRTEAVAEHETLEQEEREVALAEIDEKFDMAEDNRAESLTEYYKLNLRFIDEVEEAIATLNDANKQKRAVMIIDRALSESPYLTDLYQEVYDISILQGGGYPSDDEIGIAHKDEFKRFSREFTIQKSNLRGKIKAKIAHIEAGKSIQDPQIQIDRNSDAYKKLVTEYRNVRSADPDQQVDAESQYIPLPPSTSVISLSAETPGAFVLGRIATEGLSDNAIKLINKAKPGELSIFNAYRKSVFMSSKLRLKEETPLFSSRVDGKDVPREAAILNISADGPAVKVMAQEREDAIEQYRARNKNEAPAYHRTIAKNEDDVLRAIENAAKDVKEGEALTILLHAHGNQSPDDRLPKEMRGLLGSQKSYYRLESEEGSIPVSHDRMREVFFKLEDQGVRVNLILLNCYAGGGVAVDEDTEEFGRIA